MRNVNVKFLRPGQIVADVVTNTSGAVLCPIGYTLTEQSIERLKNARVASVWVEGSSNPPVDVEARSAALEARFAGVDDPVLLDIKAILLARIDRLREEFGG